MIGNKIKYTCKNCGWEAYITAQWSDIKPKRCMNKKCNTSFLANKDALLIEKPEPEKDEQVQLPEKKSTKKSRKHKESKQE